VRKLLLAALAAAFLLTAGLVVMRPRRFARPTPREPTASPIRVLPPDSAIPGLLESARRIGDYDIRILGDTAAREQIVDIHHRGRRVFARRAPSITLEHAGADLTGDRVPDLVVVEFSGGLHCCTRSTLLSLGPVFEVAGAVEGGHGDVAFEDLDGDGVVEARAGDWRFAYWRDVPFSDTPVPEVVFRLTPRGFRPACDLMREGAPGETELLRRARTFSRGWDSVEPPVDLWAYAVELVYSGNAPSAWQLLDLAWPAGVPGKAEFVRDLKARLKGAPCYSEGPGPIPEA
jgi:hypothetical protein